MSSDYDSDAVSAGPGGRVPVTIVTGALGAGKSTLMRHILTAKHGFRIAVIENEFSRGAGIEGLILKDGVEGGAAEGFYELANGCVCCSLKDSLIVTLELLMQQREKFDYILVETSGLADPGPVAAVFWTDLGDDSQLCLDGIVTVVDSAHILKSLGHQRRGFVAAAERQLAYADVVLLNKCDLVSDMQLEAIAQRVQAVAPAAKLVRTTRSSADVARLLNIGAFTVREQLPTLLHSSEPDSTDRCCGCSGASHEPHVHDPGVRSILLRTRARVDIDRFREWMGTVLWEMPAAAAVAAAQTAGGGAVEEGEEGPPLLEEAPPAASPLSPAAELQDDADALAAEHAGALSLVFRGKGVVYAASAATPSLPPQRYIFQSVFSLFDVALAAGSAAARDADEFDGETRVLLIGRGLDEAALREGLAACALRVS